MMEIESDYSDAENEAKYDDKDNGKQSATKIMISPHGNSVVKNSKRKKSEDERLARW